MWTFAPPKWVWLENATDNRFMHHVDNVFFGPGRRNPAAGVHIQRDHSTFVLLTVRTRGYASWLANDEAHALLKETWKQSTAWLVGEYVLMPDHIHAFCAPYGLDHAIEAWIKYWKREFFLKDQRPKWRFQSRGWHHRLREDESYSQKWIYVQQNPVRKGLVKSPEDWPYKGRIFDLRWSGSSPNPVGRTYS